MKDDDYRFEESDDPRTWEPGELVADSEHAITIEQYWDDFTQLVNACGQVAYFWKMARNYTSEGKNSAKQVAEKYRHNLTYYRKQKKNWVFETKRALRLWQLDAHALSVGFSLDEEKERDFLNGLVINNDRRDCARVTIKYAKSKNLLLSFDEIEARYEARLERRRKRQAKEGPFD